MKKSICQTTWLLCLFSLIFSCTQYPVDELLSAPEQIEIDGREYILEAHLNRDFFPPHPLNGRPLTAILYVVATDSLPFPSSLDAKWLWVIKENDVWETELVDHQLPSAYAYKLKKVSKKYGPKWGPYIYVDVVVWIMDDEEGAYLVRASEVWIHRSD